MDEDRTAAGPDPAGSTDCGAGVITVFLSLLLPVVLTVFATCLESARYEGLRLRSRLAADVATGSLAANYDRALYERYGLLFICTAGDPQDELEELAKTYAIRNTHAEEGRNGLLSLKLIRTEASQLHTAAAEGGRVFLQAVGAYMQDSGRMEAARAAAAEAGAVGFGQTKIALVEYLMREFSALTDEGASGCQLEHCATGADGRSACLQEAERRLFTAREELYRPYFQAQQVSIEGGDPNGPSESTGGEADLGPPQPSPEELAREAALRDVRDLLNGKAAAEFADGSGRQLTYLQFVRGWLYRLDLGLLQRRAMEAIRDDLRSVEPAFDFSNCICGGTMSFWFRSDRIVPFSLFSRSYEFRYTERYAY